jgi:hypothetical protein
MMIIPFVREGNIHIKPWPRFFEQHFEKQPRYAEKFTRLIAL